MKTNDPITNKELPTELIDEVAAQYNTPVSSELDSFVAALIERFSDSLDAVLLYGSCLHSNCSLEEGIVDLYVLVDDYRNAYPQQRLLALGNEWLPPNVFYIEVRHQEKTLRAKYAVISTVDFEYSAQFWFHSYIWARFAQPSRLLFARDDRIRASIYHAIAHSIITFLKSGIAAIEAGVLSVEEIWTRCLMLTYASELRAEKETRARHLAQTNLIAFTRLTQAASPLLTTLIQQKEGAEENLYQCLTTSVMQRHAQWRWRLRRWQGRILSLLRLGKAVFTFANGVEYAVWKIERHTGVRVEITPMLRRHPILLGLVALRQLLRRGVLR